MQTRRVLTGHDPSGKAIVVSDEHVDGVRIGLTRAHHDNVPSA